MVSVGAKVTPLESCGRRAQSSRHQPSREELVAIAADYRARRAHELGGFTALLGLTPEQFAAATAFDAVRRGARGVLGLNHERLLGYLQQMLSTRHRRAPGRSRSSSRRTGMRVGARGRTSRPSPVKNWPW
jgi:hypothetical protein